VTNNEIAVHVGQAWERVRAADPNALSAYADVHACELVACLTGYRGPALPWRALGAAAFGSANRNTKRGDSLAFWREFTAVVRDALDASV
jgi:hypothetical protein